MGHGPGKRVLERERQRLEWSGDRTRGQQLLPVRQDRSAAVLVQCCRPACSARHCRCHRISRVAVARTRPGWSPRQDRSGANAGWNQHRTAVSGPRARDPPDTTAPASHRHLPCNPGPPSPAPAAPARTGHAPAMSGTDVSAVSRQRQTDRRRMARAVILSKSPHQRYCLSRPDSHTACS